MPRNSHVKKPDTIKVELERKMAPRIRQIQKRWGLEPAEAVEMGITLACAASDGLLVRTFKMGRDKSGRPESVSEVLRDIGYVGPQGATA